MAPGASLRKVRQWPLHNILHSLKTSNLFACSLNYIHRNVSCIATCTGKYTACSLVGIFLLHYPPCTGVLSVLSRAFAGKGFNETRTYFTCYVQSIVSCYFLQCAHRCVCFSRHQVLPVSSWCVIHPRLYTISVPQSVKVYQIHLASGHVTSTIGKENLG